MTKKLLLFLMALCFCLLQTGIALAGVRIVIDKSTNQLHYYKDEILLKTFPVATGKSISLTPEGNFTIIRKVVNPYYCRNGGIPGGSPLNPLGARWMGLNIGGGGLYGIHGTNNPSSIGTYASAGCIRMFNQDACWLYDHTPVGTPVKIFRSSLAQVPAQPQPQPKLLPVTVLLSPYTIEVKEPAGTSQDGAPLLPLRMIFETLGYTIAWSDTNHNLVVTKGTERITVSTLSRQVTAGQITFSCPELKIVQGTTHAPLSFWQKTLPAWQISWDANQRQVTFSPKIALEQPNLLNTVALPSMLETSN
ncbi:putative L,D-transpeptidase YkuD [Sporotomaculum syntrophicum]|uniref:L,D-transpeptidase YkuD n=1 Tax=Sporotomaculum syntrophicum TaxID=182264 RepID=A0A9D2WNP9_9FIRM|nr:L,D-transpeptidase family protein [Sporotomaculum syntrophicum]KAF1084126.1 putative L,D-transpeptidase YkuD [Sporotomaculum syntrophicum]